MTLHDLVADELERADPATREALLRIPIENIDRWIANGHTAPHRLEVANDHPGSAWVRRRLQPPGAPAAGFFGNHRARARVCSIRRCAHSRGAGQLDPTMRLQSLKHQQTPLGEREAATARRNLSLLLPEHGVA